MRCVSRSSHKFPLGHSSHALLLALHYLPTALTCATALIHSSPAHAGNCTQHTPLLMVPRPLASMKQRTSMQSARSMQRGGSAQLCNGMSRRGEAEAMQGDRVYTSQSDAWHQFFLQSTPL
jgi:hypothetical protein